MFHKPTAMSSPTATNWAYFQVAQFVNEECIPAHDLFEAQLGEGASRWEKKPAILEELKVKAKKLGLWNMFLAGHEGAGFSNVEYGLMAEYLGRSQIASEVYHQYKFFFRGF